MAGRAGCCKIARWKRPRPDASAAVQSPDPRDRDKRVRHEQDLRRSREAGYERHLTKPVDFNVLLGVIEGATN